MIKIQAFPNNSNVFAQTAYTSLTAEASLVTAVTGRADLLKLQALLDRALNCAPEFGADWFELSDRLDQFLTDQGISRIVKEN